MESGEAESAVILSVRCRRNSQSGWAFRAGE